MDRFFIYEEYGAKYELMIKDVASAHRTMPRWDSYQKGLEVLAASLDSANSQGNQSKKSLTMGDLLVKVRLSRGQLIRPICGGANMATANPTSVQVPTAFCRASQAYAGGGLSEFPHGDREYLDQIARDYLGDQQGHR